MCTTIEHHTIDTRLRKYSYSGTSLRQTPLRPTKLSIIERVSSGQGFVIHYVDCIWDSVSVHYREGVLWSGVYKTYYVDCILDSVSVHYRGMRCPLRGFHCNTG